MDILRLLAAALLVILPTGAQTLPDKAICPVCAVLEAPKTPEPEKVKAGSEYAGKPYYFCSPDCKIKFDEDPPGFIPPVFPYPAPSASVLGLDGREITLKTYRGKAVLLDFWATWCKPCEKLMPDLQKLHDQYAAKGLAVLGISIDEGKDAAGKVQKFVGKKKIAYPVFLDLAEEPAWAAFHVKAIPVLFLIDPQGQVVGRWQGGFDYREVEAEVNRLLEH